MKANSLQIALVGCLVLALAACSQNGASAPRDKTLPSPATNLPGADVQRKPATRLPPHESRKDNTPVTLPAQILSTSGVDSLVADAKADLAQRLSVSVAEIALVKAEAVVWPDSSLGCPQPGMAYLQVPEDGALIILWVAGIVYEYHNGGSRGLFLCEKVYKDSNPPPKIELFNLTPSKSDSPTPGNSIPPGEDQ